MSSIVVTGSIYGRGSVRSFILVSQGCRQEQNGSLRLTITALCQKDTEHLLRIQREVRVGEFLILHIMMRRTATCCGLNISYQGEALKLITKLLKIMLSLRLSRLRTYKVNNVSSGTHKLSGLNKSAMRHKDGKLTAVVFIFLF